MSRTITVKGTGNVSLKPDTTIVTMTLKAKDKNYEKAMNDAAGIFDNLKSAVRDCGFDEKELKTTSFNVYTEYDSVQDARGNYKSVFSGYCCVNTVKLSFDFDTKRLSKVLSAVASCIAEPDLNIQFTVKDKDAAADELLKSAAENARHKAEILTAASGVKLGQLVAVNYSWGEIDVYSRTECAMDRNCYKAKAASTMDMCFEPEDIELDDTVTFVWEICE